MSKSIYGGGNGGDVMAIRTHQIYGSFSGGSDAPICCNAIEPSVPPLAVLEQLMFIIQNMKTAISQFYPRAMGLAPIVGNMSMSAGLPFVVLVRMKWIELYGKETVVAADGSFENVIVPFNKYSETHRLQLKDLYLAAGRDWRTDPMFIALGLVV
jgi:hypothetical protein